MEETSRTLEVVECLELPDPPRPDCVYRLLPREREPGLYEERTDRNIGWITEAEQALLRQSIVAVAGCGGMGGVAAELLLRAGIGEIRIADPELFDTSNIHRQIAAGVDTVGISKVFATAERLRGITDDTTLVVYPQGVVPATFAHFVQGADLVLDEVEHLSDHGLHGRVGARGDRRPGGCFSSGTRKAREVPRGCGTFRV